jgi:hypothetical protein
MNTNKVDRRRIIVTAAGAGLGALLCGRVSAQPAPDAAAAAMARDAGRLHREQLEQTRKRLKGASIISEEGLERLVDLLVELGLIKEAQAEILKDLIRVIFNSKTLEEIRDGIGKFRIDAEKAGDIVIAIVGIARDSADFATHLIEKIPVETAVNIVASDIMGAIEGAAAGPAILPLIGIPELGPLVVILCLLAGAGASSARAAFAKPT